MATVLITQNELETEKLPTVCVCCGRAADQSVRVTFWWCPVWLYAIVFALGWLGLLVLPVAIILFIVFMKRRRTRMPVCKAHRFHWRWRRVLLLCGLAGVMAASITLGILASRGIGPLNWRDDGLVLAFIAPLGLLVLYLFPAALIQSSAVRAAEIRPEALFLMSVSKRFVQALQANRDKEFQAVPVVAPITAQPLGYAENPDTKLCPYCAEAIKASAVKCRFCCEFLD